MSKAKKAALAQQSSLTGSFVFKDQSVYEGEYKDINGVIVRQGEGKFQSTVHQTKYTGTWLNDKLNGKGIPYRRTAGIPGNSINHPNLSVGKVEYRNGAFYEGTLKENRYEGEGRFQWPDGSAYVGEWHDNRMHGTGKFIGALGDVWVGQFVNGNGENLSQELS